MASVATLVTPAERQRYTRIVRAAEAMLAQDGEQGLQMKDLALRADVALKTLYRYFPSKDHVLGAVAVARHERALQRLESKAFAGETPGERAGDALLREFRTVQRDVDFAVAIQRIANAPDRATSEFSERITALMGEIVLGAIAQGGTPATVEQRSLLPLVVSAASGAITQWLSGVIAAEQARQRIRTAARLFDLPPEIVREYLSTDS